MQPPPTTTTSARAGKPVDMQAMVPLYSPPMSDETRYDVAVIGGGPTGLFGVFYAGLRGMSAILFESLPELGGQLTTLYPEKIVFDMPGFPEILARDLAAEMVKQIARFKPTVRLREPVQTLRKVADRD